MKVLSFLVFFFCFSASAYELELRSLADFSTKKIKILPEKAHVWIVFQEKCSACRKQIKDLQCLEKTAQTYLVGAFSNEQSLRKEYQRLNTPLIGLYGDSHFKDLFQINEQVTPQILISYNKKNYLIVGFTACTNILKFLKSKEKAS